MIKVTIITTGGRTSDIFEESKTPKEILESLQVDYTCATNTLDGVKLDVSGMNKSLRDLGVTKDCRLSSIVKIDNNANVVVAGHAAILTSAAKREDLVRILAFDPDALTLYDDETDEPVFKVSVDDGPGSANENGVLFGSSVDQEGHAQVTVLLDPEEEDKLSMVRESLGSAILNLIQIEEDVPEILKSIEKKEAEINEHITLM